MITASRNPADENGFKLVRGGAIPLGSAWMEALRERVGALLAQAAPVATGSVALVPASYRADYIRWLQKYSGAARLRRRPAASP